MTGTQEEIILLQLSRSLKAVHPYLRAALAERIKAEGRNLSIARANSSLRSMEQELRHLLLDYSALQPAELRAALLRACHHAAGILHFLAQVHPAGTLTNYRSSSHRA